MGGGGRAVRERDRAGYMASVGVSRGMETKILINDILMAHCSALIHIAINFQIIPYGYLVIVCTRTYLK